MRRHLRFLVFQNRNPCYLISALGFIDSALQCSEYEEYSVISVYKRRYYEIILFKRFLLNFEQFKCSTSLTLRSTKPLLCKIIEDPKGLLIVWVITMSAVLIL